MTAHELAALLLAGPDTVVTLDVASDFERLIGSQNLTVQRSPQGTWIRVEER